MQTAGRLSFALFMAALVLIPRAGDAISPQHAVPAAASYKATLDAYRAGCGWVANTLPDPAWRPFLKPLDRACEAIGKRGSLLLPESATPATEAAGRFVHTLAGVTRALDAIYMAAWREKLDGDGSGMDTVALNGSGVFLAFKVENAFALARDVLRAHGDRAQTAEAVAFE